MKKTITESQLRKIIEESVWNYLKESDDFIPHGGRAVTNSSGIEMQVDDRGEYARLRYSDGEITDWLEISFDEDGVAFVTTEYGMVEKLSDYLRY